MSAAGAAATDARRRVVITGLGVISAAGAGIEPTWKRIATDPPEARPIAGPPPVEMVEFPVFQAVDYDLAATGVPERAVQWIRDEGLTAARDLHHLLAATALALADAGLPDDLSGLDPPAAVIVGDESPGFDQVTRTLFRFADGTSPPDDPLRLYADLVDDFFQLNTFVLPYYLARAFRFRGLGLFVNSACTSGLNCLDLAAGEIRAGRSEVAVAVAGENPLSVAKFLWFHDLGMYAMDGRIRPFDTEQTGLVFGEGAAALVLEDRDAALGRGAPVYAEVLGAGFAQDGWKITAPSPCEAAAAAAMTRALAEAGLAPGEIDLAVPHGVGSPASDAYEAAMLHRVFGGDGALPPVTALKPYFGHNLGGSALLETALLARAIAAGAVPPTPGHRTPYARHPLPVVRSWERRPIERALKLTCGFAGFYGALVLGRDAGARAAATPTTADLQAPP